MKNEKCEKCLNSRVVISENGVRFECNLPPQQATACLTGRANWRYELVRCKDCINMKEATVNKKGFLICPASGMEITEFDFCSYGDKGDDV